MKPELPGRRPTVRRDVPSVPLAMLAGLMLGGGFFGLLTVIFPGVGFLALAGLLMLLFFWAQYVVWGRPLYAYVVRKEREAQEWAAAQTDSSVVSDSVVRS